MFNRSFTAAVKYTSEFVIKSSDTEILFNSFMTRGRYHIETSPLICSANQWTGFYMITASVMKELNKNNFIKR